jgi:plasmid stabilization system protein ParE
MKIRFSRIATYKLERLSEYLIERWSEKSNQKFLNTLDDKIQLILKNPESCPKSDFDQDLRRCVVTEQTSFLYEIRSDAIFVLTVIDARQNPEKIREEIEREFRQ